MGNAWKRVGGEEQNLPCPTLETAEELVAGGLWKRTWQNATNQTTSVVSILPRHYKPDQFGDSDIPQCTLPVQDSKKDTLPISDSKKCTLLNSARSVHCLPKTASYVLCLSNIARSVHCLTQIARSVHCLSEIATSAHCLTQ